MSYIITDDKHYKNIANSIRSKMLTDREYYPEDMAIAINNIPSSADGTDNPVIGIYYTNPDGNGNPTKVKISGWVNPTGGFITDFIYPNCKLSIHRVEFSNCNFINLNNNMFDGCANLENVILPDSLTKIGAKAFQNCQGLTTVNLPSYLTTISERAFAECWSLKTINLPDSLIELGDYAFYATALKTINLPNSLKTIRNKVFMYCKSLEYVTLGDNFNCNNVNLSSSTLYTRETILQWLNALADRTGQTAYKLTIGATNLAKLTEQDILIATNKNWTLS